MIENLPNFADIPYQPLAAGPETAASTEPLRRVRRSGANRPAVHRSLPQACASDDALGLHARKRRRCAFEPEGLCGLEAPAGLGAPNRAPMPVVAPVHPAGADAPSAAAPGVATAAPGEHGIWQSLRDCLSMFKDPGYVSGLGCMLAASVGTGLIDSGYLMTLQGAGQQPLLINQIMEGVKDIATIPALFLAYYLVDRAAASREHHPDVPQRYLRGLARCGVVDLGLGAGLAASVWARDRNHIGHFPLLIAVAVGQTVDSIKTVLDFGYWRCAKMNIGSVETQRKQRDLQMQMIAVEMALFFTISYSQSVGVYACALRYAPHRLMRAGVLSLAVGGVLAFLPKTYFWIKAGMITRRRRDMPEACPC